jgi:hypothetical protein
MRSAQKKMYPKKSSIGIHDIVGCEVPAFLVSIMKRLTTSRRDDAENLSSRYRKFDIPSLMDEAVKAAGKDAQACMCSCFPLSEVADVK